MKEEKVLLCGFQASGDGRLHVGNLLGSLEPFARAVEEATDRGENCLGVALIADAHALSVGPKPGLEASSLRLAKELRARLGPDALIARQSRIAPIFELFGLILGITPVGELLRQTHFEQKSAGAGPAQGVSALLLAYPALMSADILALGADEVLVGEDQRQHMELARDISRRLIGLGAGAVKEPRGRHASEAARVMDLRDPERKMSKSSASEDGLIYLSDPEPLVARKIKRAVMDSEFIGVGPELDARLGLRNLAGMLGSLQGISAREALAPFDGMGHGALKARVAELLCEALARFRDPAALGSEEQALTQLRRSEGLLSARAQLALRSARAALMGVPDGVRAG